jgi:hypothetical protein
MLRVKGQVANEVNRTAYEKMTKNSKKITQETNTQTKQKNYLINYWESL